MPPEAMAGWLHMAYATRCYGGMSGDHMTHMPPEAMAGMDARYDGQHATRSYGWYGC